jgi:hypothetical protein
LGEFAVWVCHLPVGGDLQRPALQPDVIMVIIAPLPAIKLLLQFKGNRKSAKGNGVLSVPAANRWRPIERVSEKV